VRLTAQRLITDLLPWGQNPDPRAYHLDLTGASLEYFRLEGRRIGRLTVRRTRFYGVTRLSEVHASKPALFSGATFLGRVDLREARFEGGISFQETAFNGEVAFNGASVSTFIDLNTAAPERQTALSRSPKGPWSRGMSAAGRSLDAAGPTSARGGGAGEDGQAAVAGHRQRRPPAAPPCRARTPPSGAGGISGNWRDSGRAGRAAARSPRRGG